MFQLYGYLGSRSDRVHWLLEELQLDYQFYQLDFRRGDHRSEFYLARNPDGKVPALQHGDVVLTESAAICGYLCDLCPEKALIPAVQTVDRARYNQWVSFVITELEQPLWTKGKHFGGLPESLRLPQILDTAIWEFQRASGILEKHLQGRRTMLNETFSASDIMVATTLRWATRFDFPVSELLRDFMLSMEERPAYARMVAKERLSIDAP